MPQISLQQLIKRTLYLCLMTGTTISCISKACFNKLHPKWTLVQTNIYKVNGSNGNSHGPIGTGMCTLAFPKKFQQQFIICEHLLCHVILELNFSHNDLIGIDWFPSYELHLHQGPRSIVILDPALFQLHINQISTLPPLHILIQTISQVTIPPRL